MKIAAVTPDNLEEEIQEMQQNMPKEAPKGAPETALPTDMELYPDTKKKRRYPKLDERDVAILSLEE